MSKEIVLSLKNRRKVTLCNHNYSEIGILHPDRVMQEYDLLYMQKGSWDVIEEEKTYHLSEGSILLLEPGLHHYSLEKCSPKMRNIYIHFEFEKDDFSYDIPSNSENIEIPGWDNISSPHITVSKFTSAADKPEIRHIFEKIIDTFWSYEPDRELRCSLFLEELLLALSDIRIMNKGQTDTLVSEIVHRFQCEPERFFSPEKLAADYGVSIRTISSRFKKKTGMSIHAYQVNLKLDMAYDDLPFSQGRSLHDIATGYGFYDEFQFSKLFKRKFGISPSMRR